MKRSIFLYSFPDTKRVVFVIISQENSYHNQLANSLKNDIQKQAEQLLYQVNFYF